MSGDPNHDGNAFSFDCLSRLDVHSYVALDTTPDGG